MIDFNAWPSLPAMFFAQAATRGAEPFLWSKADGTYRSQSWAEIATAVKDLSRGLRRLGLERGDRVVVVSENRPEWLVADLAIMAAGGITVPAYTTNTAADHRHILSDSGARGVIVSTPALADRVVPALPDSPDCRWLVAMETLAETAPEGCLSMDWRELCESGAREPDDVEDLVGQADRDETACFIYTSGTGGAPKGVMLSHANILCNCMGAYHLLRDFGLGHETFLSFLPLSHSYEHTAGQFFPISIAAQIYYAESADQLLTNLAEVRPTIMTAVPRLYEAMHQRIRRGVIKQGGLKQTLFNLAETLGRKRIADPASLGPLERIQDTVVERLVRDKVRQRFGGRLKAMVSGGAALNPEIGDFFTAMGLRILQGYGLTEASPVIAANPPGLVRMETVGPPLKGVEVRIADDGEILVRGELVMQGYWGDAEATKVAIRDGWLHTGDIGEFDRHGYLKITDRKKDILVLSGGDNISPARIESILTLEPEIGQAMVYGDKRPNLVALLVPDETFLTEWKRAAGKKGDLTSLAGDAELLKALAGVVDRVNKGLSNLEKVRRFILAAEAFTVDNAMMTPTLKIRRHVIKARFGEALDGLYRKS